MYMLYGWLVLNSAMPACQGTDRERWQHHHARGMLQAQGHSKRPVIAKPSDL